MFLTAQRVHSLAPEKTGVNAFLYRHGAQTIPGMSWEHPVVERVADQYVGTRGPEHIEIAPGGNRVLSYLDVVAADDTPPADVEAALREFGATFVTEELPASRTLGRVAIRFGAQLGLYERARDEFDEIAARALELLRNPSEPAWRSAEPLDVDVTHEGGKDVFTLRGESVPRVWRACEEANANAPAFRACVPTQTRTSLEAIHADVYLFVVPEITGLDLEHVAALGGVRFHDAATGDVLREWPAR